MQRWLIKKQNQAAFRLSLEKLGAFMGQKEPITQLEPREEYSLYVDKFSAKYM